VFQGSLLSRTLALISKLLFLCRMQCPLVSACYQLSYLDVLLCIVYNGLLKVNNMKIKHLKIFQHENFPIYSVDIAPNPLLGVGYDMLNKETTSTIPAV